MVLPYFWRKFIRAVIIICNEIHNYYFNLKEYVSDIIAKLLPQELPPWQITVIPTQQDKTYLLIRLHHLYLSEDGLSLGELLLLRNDDYLLTPTGIDPWADGSVLAGVFKTPVVIPQVRTFTLQSSNRFNTRRKIKNDYWCYYYTIIHNRKSTKY